MDDSKTQKPASAIELESKALAVRGEMNAIKIVDQASYDLAVEALTRANAFLKEAAEFFDPNIKKAHDLHKELLKQKATVISPVEGPVKTIKGELVRFTNEQERLRQEEQRRIGEQARKEAEDQRLADAEHMVAQGVDEADALEMIVQAPVPVAAPRVEHSYVPSKAVVMAETWSGVCDDKGKVIEAAAAGNASAKGILEVNQPALNGMARSLKEGLAEAVPGTRAVKSSNVRSGRG